VFNRPSVTSIAERGPEAVIPLKGGKVPVQMSGGGGGGPSIVVTGNTFFDMPQMLALMQKIAVGAVTTNYDNNGVMRSMVRGL
jgi:hypothetical protein